MSKLAKLLAEKSAQDQEKLKNDYLGSNSRDIFVTGANTYVQIALENIKPNKFQPRMVFDELELQSLANSIKELGLLQPIIVRSSGESNQYEIISGERRYRAFQLLEKPYIDCIVMDATDEKNSLLALAENINREDLTDYEIAKSVIAFKNGFPNKSEYANTLGISRQDLYRLLSFEKLPLEIQQRLDNSPTLLTAKTAEQIGQFIKNNDIASEKMVEILNEVLDLVLTEGLKQNGILNEIEIRVKGNKGNNIKNGNRTVKIFAIDGKKVGQIKKNLNKTTIEFSNDILDQHQQAIEKFFETLISS
ncbi:ParB/RepB/Spo0J family partition protein [Pseudoduganella danionis]|jgi:ParB family transcriptional regulator, chromosome partitioning protein|uniref:ParB-like N-terminal domain-containing protein n=2 Tax=Gammaproteobacteria TaxID=1236 RepID=A0A2I1RF18_FAUOS|nr:MULTISPECIES: ParB/RepB/Spo0J family partition protein [Moraxella]MDI4481527.1 ParB/RepB/Spo0J family partition protein [Moraxella osloensis]PKZ67723.1 hypothetical protein CYJ96_12275 [Moraxella osloensis]